jgi:hypothetical protein
MRVCDGSKFSTAAARWCIRHDCDGHDGDDRRRRVYAYDNRRSGRRRWANYLLLRTDSAAAAAAAAASTRPLRTRSLRCRRVVTGGRGTVRLTHTIYVHTHTHTHTHIYIYNSFRRDIYRCINLRVRRSRVRIDHVSANCCGSLFVPSPPLPLPLPRRYRIRLPILITTTIPGRPETFNRPGECSAYMCNINNVP